MMQLRNKIYLLFIVLSGAIVGGGYLGVTYYGKQPITQEQQEVLSQYVTDGYLNESDIAEFDGDITLVDFFILSGRGLRNKYPDHIANNDSKSTTAEIMLGIFALMILVGILLFSITIIVHLSQGVGNTVRNLAKGVKIFK